MNEPASDGPIQPGSPAPDFTLTREDGSEFTRADLEGNTTVLVFYPFAFSPVCSDQIGLYEEVLSDFAERGATMYGVSCDARLVADRVSREARRARSRSCRISSPRARPAAHSASTTRAASRSAHS